MYGILTGVTTLMSFIRRSRRVGHAANLLNGRNRFENTRHHLAGAGALGGVGETTLQQLGIRENDAELVVEPVEQPGQICRWGLTPWSRQTGMGWCAHHHA